MKRNAFVFLLVALVALLGVNHEANSAFNPTPTGTGYRHVTGGKEDPASVALIPLAAGGSAANLSACNASDIATINVAGSALECHHYISDGSGASVPATGLVRVSDTGTQPVLVGLSGGVDENGATYSSGSAAWTWGNTSQYSYLNGYGLFLTSQSTPGTITDGLSGRSSDLLTITQSLVADFTTTIVTATNLNLTFTATAGEVWHLDFWCTCQNTSGGIKFQISAPATGTVEGWLDSVTTTAILLSRQRFTAINTLNTTATNTGVSVPAITRITARLNAVAGGTVGIGVASVTAGQTTTVRAGSSLHASRTTPL